MINENGNFLDGTVSPFLFGRGHVYHARKEGGRNQFRYPTFFILFNCAYEEALNRTFKQKFKGWLKFVASDYLTGGRRALAREVRGFLSEQCQYEPEQIWLHTLPRMFGYAFNPVSFWFCLRQGCLEAVLVGVNNTFTERHFYFIKPELPIESKEWLKTEKKLHVSPFFPVDGHYEFRFQLNAKSSRVDINYFGPDGSPRLLTWVTGEHCDLREQSPIELARDYGWLTVMVVLRIHWQALILFLKRTQFFRKPPLAEKQVTR